MANGYDLIGDVHGRATSLENLLGQMGYAQTHGTYSHPDGRTVIFVGDMIDRGPEQERALSIVRSMIDGGHAQAILGNHEFNAICYATMDEKGRYMRAHSANNIRQHAAFLQEFPLGSDKHKSTLAWMATLPLYLDLGPIRTIHACWHQPDIDILQPHMGANNTITTDMVATYSRDTGAVHHGLETLLKGPALTLPNGLSFKDRQGHTRNEARLLWWSDRNEELPNLIDPLVATIPAEHHNNIRSEILLKHTFNNAGKPTFIGHYSLTPPTRMLSGSIVGLDYRKQLTAYRWTPGEALSPSNFVSVPAP